MERKKLAIIGASVGQYALCMKAKEMGLETFCFAYEKGAICKEIVDHFFPISITEKDQIVNVCKEVGVEAIVSNASEMTAEVVAYVADRLGLTAPSLNVLKRLQNKYAVRQLTDNIEGLSSPRFYQYEGQDLQIYPCVVKPCKGGGKKGVSFVKDASEFPDALKYANQDTTGIIIEEYIEGKELSIECLSYKGKHYIIQITDKDSSSAPHFVELGHHQPADITDSLKARIHKVIPTLLAAIGYDNGASHIEIKYNGENIYLIETNLRGGGDDISNKLVFMSSGIDYLKCMIQVAFNQFQEPKVETKPSYAGIYYLCKQTENLLPFFKEAMNKEWLIEEKIYSTDLEESHSNYERNGYLIYKSSHKITPNSI